MGNSKQTALDKLIDKRCYDVMYKAVAKFVEERFDSIDLRGSSNRVQQPDEASLYDMEIIKAFNAVAEQDKVSFDVIVSCDIEIEETVRRNRETDSVRQWFKLSCEAILGNGLMNVQVVNLEVYSA